MLIYDFQIDYCEEHESFYACADWAFKVAKNPGSDLISKQAAKFWKADPRKVNFWFLYSHSFLIIIDFFLRLPL
jgi:hypothetical protein